jgi:hypothetical protein
MFLLHPWQRLASAVLLYGAARQQPFTSEDSSSAKQQQSLNMMLDTSFVQSCSLTMRLTLLLLKSKLIRSCYVLNALAAGMAFMTSACASTATQTCGSTSQTCLTTCHSQAW